MKLQRIYSEIVSCLETFHKAPLIAILLLIAREIYEKYKQVIKHPQDNPHLLAWVIFLTVVTIFLTSYLLF